MNVKRFFVAFGTPLLIATLVSSFFNFSAIPYLIGIAAAIFIALFSVINSKYNKALGIAFIVVVYAILSFNYKEVSQVIPISNLSEKVGVVEAQITDIIDEGNSNSYILKVTNHSFAGVPKKFKVKTYSFWGLKANLYDTVKLTLKFKSIENISSFNLNNLYMADNIYIQAYITGNQAEIIPNAAKPVLYYLKAGNKWLADQFDVYIGGKQGQLVKSMLLGDKDNFDKQLSYSLAKSGIIHITAVSGLHVSIVAGILIFLFRILRVKPKLSAILLIILIWTYVLFTGFSFSAIRAGIMFTMIQLGVLFSQIGDPLNSLFLAGSLIVLINPFSVLDIGFLLTFSCTFGVVCVSKIIENHFKITTRIKNKPLRNIYQMIITSFAVMLCSLPALFLINKGISILTPLINVIVIPLTAIIVVISLLFVFVLMFLKITFFTTAFAVILKFLTNIIIVISEKVAGIDGLFIGLDFKFTAIIIICFSICFLMAYMFNTKTYEYIVFVLITTFMVIPVANSFINYNKTEITSFSSYEGGYIVSITKNTATVFILSTDMYTGVTIAKFLDGKNISEIDNLIILSEDANSLSSIEVLTSVKNVENKFINAANGISPAAEMNNGYTRLPTDSTYKVSDTIRVINGSSVVTSRNRIVLTLTNEYDVATTVKCNYLFYNKALLDDPEALYPAGRIFSFQCNGAHREGVICVKEKPVQLVISKYSSTSVNFL